MRLNLTAHSDKPPLMRLVKYQERVWLEIVEAGDTLDEIRMTIFVEPSFDEALRRASEAWNREIEKALPSPSLELVQ